MKDIMNYVNIYLTDKAYGGREEGGWWFDCGEPHLSVLVLPSQTSDEVYEMLQPYVDDLNEGRPDISSVLSIGRYIICKEDHIARAYPSVRPHYE